MILGWIRWLPLRVAVERPGSSAQVQPWGYRHFLFTAQASVVTEPITVQSASGKTVVLKPVLGICSTSLAATKPRTR
jgi:hypothetical protein